MHDINDNRIQLVRPSNVIMLPIYTAVHKTNTTLHNW